MTKYVKAIIQVEVPEWQIGEKVSLYFPDTMQKSAICERADNRSYAKCIRCGRALKDPISQSRGYGDVCWKKHLTDKQRTLF